MRTNRVRAYKQEARMAIWAITWGVVVAGLLSPFSPHSLSASVIFGGWAGLLSFVTFKVYPMCLSQHKEAEA